MYGEPGAEYMEDAGQQQGGDMGGIGGPSGGGGGAPFGGGLDDLGAPGASDEGEIAGAEGSTPTGNMPSGDNNPSPMQQTENFLNKKGKLINESKENNKLNMLFEKYMSHIDENVKRDKINVSRTDVFDKSVLINDEFNKMINSLDSMIVENKD